MAILNKQRTNRGNMLVLMTAVTLAVVLALIFFGLKYTRILGSNQEQRTAIEAAALAAANDLSKVVVEDANFGFISLSDYAPSGTATTADDNYAMPVQSINTLFATIRADMIIANEMGDATMLKLAQEDYKNALLAKDLLVDALNDSLAPGGGGAKFIDGIPLDPYNDAVTAYEQNIIRMTGSKSKLDRTTFKLTLGCIPGVPTNSPVPQPVSYANVAANQSQNGMYRAYVNVPYNGQDFVFAGIGKNIMLVDHRQWKATSGQPWDVPCIVKAEGDQIFDDNENGQAIKRTVHAAACAAPASVTDPRPAPGALVISFPDGNETPILKPGDILTNPDLQKAKIPLLSPPGIDIPVPTTLLNPIGPLPVIGGNPTISDSWRQGLYDWIKRAGPRADIQAALDMLNTPFAGTSTGGFQQVYTWDTDGKIINSQVDTFNGGPFGPVPYPMVSSDQAWGLSPGAFKNKALEDVDTYLYDNVIQPGRINGGLHGGEPYPDPTLKTATTSQTIAGLPKGTKYDGDYGGEGMGAGSGGSRDGKAGPSGSGVINPADFIPYPPSPGPGTLRPTYRTNGVAVEIRFRDWKLAGASTSTAPGGGSPKGKKPSKKFNW